uniref:Integrase, catalytic region, zinc finger, CCHC-type, peptidase aspartic, catalytic n=1 Tax=Tanacetum cinerariifolium TaxID=118510 RepID=A0A6L2NUU9_TANCI|nr:hypothetical protein [Tanacetum cinerariifolium]
MHNNIMAAGLRDRPPMLTMGRYVQWLSRFLRYIDTRPNGDAVRKCILEGPYTLSTIVVPAVKAIENSPAVPKHTTVQTLQTISGNVGSYRKVITRRMKRLEAHYSYMEKIQEVPTADPGTDSEPLEQNDQNVVDCDDEHVVLANLIANLKLDVDENKKIQNHLKKANASLTKELTE